MTKLYVILTKVMQYALWDGKALEATEEVMRERLDGPVTPLSDNDELGM